MILGDLISSNPENYNKTGFTESWESIYNWTYDITEYIGDVSGSTASGSDYWSFRGVIQYGDTWNYGNYILNSGSTNKFLSNKLSRNYTLNEHATVNTFLGDFDDFQTDYDRVIIYVRDNEGRGTRYNFINEIVSGHTKTILTVPIGPVQLNQMGVNGSIYEDQDQTIAINDTFLDETSVYYEIYFQKGYELASETIRIYLDHACYRHDGVEFLYLGELSTFETMTFRMADIKTFNTKRNEVKINHYNIKNDHYTYSIGDRGRKNINIGTTEKHKVISGWLNDDQSSDVMELLNSPEVYIIKSDGIYPIILTNTRYENKTIRNNTLFNYVIEFDMAYEKLSNT